VARKRQIIAAASREREESNYGGYRKDSSAHRLCYEDVARPRNIQRRPHGLVDFPDTPDIREDFAFAHLASPATLSA